MEPSYIFSWGNVPGNETQKLIDFIVNDLGVNWAKNAKIDKINEKRTIHIFAEEKSIEISLSNDNKKATLKISDGQTYDLQVTEGNDDLKISKGSIPELKYLIKEFIICTLDQETIKQKTIYEFVDSMYTLAHEKADNIYPDSKSYAQGHGSIIEIDLRPAAKKYLLASKALMAGVDRITDKEISRILIDASLELQREVEKTLYNEAILFANLANKYERQQRYEVSIELKNKAEALEFQKKISFRQKMKEIDAEVQIEYESLFNSALHEFEQRTGRSVAPSTGLISKKSSNVKKLLYKEAEEVSKFNVTPEQIKIKNDSRLSPLKGEYEWSVYLDAIDEIMEQIKSVTYTLHPAFPRASRTLTNREGKFRLEAAGNSEFEIKVDIEFENKKIITKYHWLDLGISKKRNEDFNMYMPDAYTGG